jgi:hypothetical protein
MTENLEDFTPILNQIIKTVEHYHPNNKGLIIAISVNNDGVITSNVGGNGKTSFKNAAMMLLDINGYVSEVYGKGEKL